VSDISLQQWKKRGRARDGLHLDWSDPPGRVGNCLEFTLAGEFKRVKRASVSLITFLFFTLLLINVYLCMCGVNVMNVVCCLKCV